SASPHRSPAGVRFLPSLCRARALERAWRNVAPRFEESDRARDALRGWLVFGVEHQLRPIRRFVRRCDSSHVADLTIPGLAIEAFGIARPAELERRAHINLHEIAGRHGGAHLLAIDAVRRDQCAQHDHARVDEQLRDLANPADVLVPLFSRETEVTTQPEPD